MSQDYISVRGARTHNLKNISVDIPRNQMVVITGLSGSGKSSLAFDTIFAEGQRRYVESLSAYARQFLGQMEKPDVDQIEGLSPAVSIDQRGASSNPRSTVGTTTEVYDYLRLLYARVGIPHCPVCGREVQMQTADQIIDAVAALPDGRRIQVLAPLIKDRKGHHQQVFEDIRKAGYVRVRVDGKLYDVNETIELDRYKNHTIEAVVDRLVIKSDLERSRLADSIETALRLGDGMVIVNDVTDKEPTDRIFSEKFACPYDGTSLPEIEPRTFSFNSPHGACEECQGLGTKLQIDPEMVVPNPDRSLNGGAIAAMEWSAEGRNNGDDPYYIQLLKATCEHYDIDLDVPWKKLNDAQREIVLYGSGDEKIPVKYQNRLGDQRIYQTTFEGVINNLRRRYMDTTSDYIRSKIEGYMAQVHCPACHGKRLKPAALAVTVGGRGIQEITSLPVIHALEWVKSLKANKLKAPEGENPPSATGASSNGSTALTTRQMTIAKQIVKEISSRLQFMVDVGLDYLTLNRATASLSGGEAQRIRLATQIGSRLTGVLYVLDEPSIGLHPRDQARLIKTLQSMRDLGNTVLVVEHDEDTMEASDWIVDLGPGAGERGGRVIFEGTYAQILKDKTSLTGGYLSGRLRIEVPQERRPGNGQFLVVRGAQENNLKQIDVEVPLGMMVCVTGVSGSGKSTLVVETLYKRLAQMLHGSHERAGASRGLEGVQHIDKIINIDQTPIGRTPRSNPATYVGFFNDIRDLFAELPESKVRGYLPGRFSFNVKGGRCEACEGQGEIQIEMQFMADMYVLCDVCHGARYNRETLQIRYKDKNIAEVLNMTVSEALVFFEAIPPLQRKLKTLEDVGLGYIRLGQPAPTMSGGEAQRVKLSKELSKRATDHTLYILDEPSVGLHAADVHKLIEVLDRLVDAGNSVLIIEHHPDIIKVADWLIDLGPEGGERGGEIVAVGTPEQIAANKQSYTGQFLKKHLQNKR
ncbi:UvrABC system protein A [Thermoflexales bacterium]|nr:UvrABC system protein A [Thermoflexales bacterium]